ncbi:MAG TPA: hypothetical protein VFO25_01510 [Candidatus Eremiobacteraceae bacterium]|nr:hypothetical protein [Candidatus Eremiobacteraceae bacterium]
MSVSRIALWAALCVALLPGCQLKSAASPPNDYITADPTTFVIKNVQRYNDPNGNTTDSLIVVIQATYTNPETQPETISPDKFALLDPNLMATYQGLSGGGISIPTMATVQLAGGKPMDITIGFRVPAAMSAARLVYKP